MLKRLLMVCALAACGGSTKQAPVENHAAVAADSMNDPEAVLRALAKAAHDDDGAALDALVHPTYGMWLWDQPGATVSPSVQLFAGGGDPPTMRIAGERSGMNEYWQENYWKSVAGSLEHGLARLDHDPVDRNAPIYGDCGAEDEHSDLRAWLVEKDSFDDTYQMLLDDAQLKLAPAMTHDLMHYRAWGLDVWLARDRGRLWVAHVMVWTPCDA